MLLSELINKTSLNFDIINFDLIAEILFINEKSKISLNNIFEKIEINNFNDDTRKINSKTIFFVTELSRKFLTNLLSNFPAVIVLDNKIKNETDIIKFIKLLYQKINLDTTTFNKNNECRNSDEIKKIPIILSCDDLINNIGKLASSYYNDPSKKLKITAVTGTNGKTSISWFLFQIWQFLKIPSAVIGTLGIYYNTIENDSNFEFTNIKTKIKKIESGFTTPRAWEIQALFSKFLECNIKKVVIEASSEGIELGRLAGTFLDTAIFNNLTQDHLDFHKTMEEYYQSKKKIIMQCINDKGKVFINKKDSYTERLFDEIKSYPNIYLIEKNNEFLTNKEIISFQKQNLNLAIHSANLSENEFTQINLYLEKIETPKGRFEMVKTKIYQNENINVQEILYAIVDYAHTPDALKIVLSEAKKIAKILICVFGCGGNRDKLKRPIMGEIASNLCDMVFICDDNPRKENPINIRNEIIRGIKKNNYKNIGDRALAIKEAMNYGDEMINKSTKNLGNVAVVVAGKGHEEFQIFENEKVIFSDKNIVLEIFNNLKS